MESNPSKIAEALVYWLLPPACREEVLGDMRERNQSSVQYLVEATCTVPSVIYSRIRRCPEIRAEKEFRLLRGHLTRVHRLQVSKVETKDIFYAAIGQKVLISQRARERQDCGGNFIFRGSDVGHGVPSR